MGEFAEGMGENARSEAHVGPKDGRGPILRARKSGQVVSAGQQEEFGPGRDEGKGSAHFAGAAERIALAVDEDGGGMQAGKVRATELVRAARGVEGVRKQEQTGGDAGLFGRQHGGLAAAIRMPSEK